MLSLALASLMVDIVCCLFLVADITGLAAQTKRGKSAALWKALA